MKNAIYNFTLSTLSHFQVIHFLYDWLMTSFCLQKNKESVEIDSENFSSIGMPL